jgi:hypothetical protein
MMLISTENTAKTGRKREPRTTSSTRATPTATMGTMELNWESKTFFVSRIDPEAPPT